MAFTTTFFHGGTRLAFDCVEGVNRIVEEMHASIALSASPLAWISKDSRGAHGKISRVVYSTIRGVNGALRAGSDQVYRLLPGHLGDQPKSEKEVRLVAALNGAIGDHLEATGNVLAIPMMLTVALAYELMPALSHFSILLPAALLLTAIARDFMLWWRPSNEETVK